MISVIVIIVTLACVAHELSRDFLTTAAAAEDLTTQSAVVAASEGCKLFVAVVTLFTLAIRHPVLFQITVLEDNNSSHLLAPKRHCMFTLQQAI